MKRIVLLPILLCLLSGCKSTDLFNTYERDELVALQHNSHTSYTLLTYRDPMGQTRHVLRRHGVCELVMTYTLVGDIALKERGAKERKISAIEAGRVTSHINDLLRIESEEKDENLSSTSI